MKVMRVGQSCLLAVLALLAFAATSASAAEYEPRALPEIGRCLKVGVGKGVYAGNQCVKVEKKGRGAYEWTPASVTEKQAFSGSGGETALTTAGHPTIKCIDTNFVGEWRGPKAATVEVEFQGCQTPLGVPCQTTPNNKSEIKSLPLEGELGFIKNQVKEGKLLVTVGLDLKPQPPSTALATYECGGGPTELNRIEGSVIGEIKPIDKMTTLQNMVYRTTSGGAQYPEAFQESPKDTLFTTFQTGLESTTAPTTLKIKNYVGSRASTMEIKSKEN